MAKQQKATPLNTKTPMEEQKPVVTTNTAISTRVHAGVALVTIGGLALAAFGFFWFNIQRLNTETAPPANQQKTVKAESKVEKVAKLTRQLFVTTTTPAAQVTTATERKAALLALAQEDPIGAQNQILGSEVVSAFPETVQAELEKEVTVNGTLEVIIGEDLDQRTHRFNLSVVQGGLRQNVLAPDAGSYTRLAGKNVSVRGYQIDDQNVLLASDGTTGSLTTDATTETTATTASSTTKNVAIILFNFVNDTRQPITPDDARSRIFSASNSVSNYDKEVSYNLVSLKGKVRVDGDVLGYFTLPSTYNSATQTCSNYFRTWSDAARQVATDAGNDLSGYDNFIFIFPRPTSTCPGWSWAEIVGDEAWINDFKIPTLAHEHGHNLGSPHSSTYICRDSAGLPTTLSTSCTVDEYGDPFDIMGGGPTGSYFHYNATHKTEIGWLPSANLQEVSASGTFTLSPLEKAATGLQAIRIPRNRNSAGQISEYLWVEFRQPYGFDTFTSSDPVANGVILRLAPAQVAGSYVSGNLGWNTLLLDTNPATSTFSDAPLAVGQTFTDGAFGITVQTVEATADHATVNVTFTGPVCTKAAPTVTLTAAAGTYGSNGQGLNYYLNVTNRDSSVCPTSTFTVTPTLPSELTQTPSPISFTLAPGATRQTVLTVTSSATAAASVYSFSETVLNTTTNLSATATSTYTVTGPDQAAPVVKISSPKNGETLRGNKAVKVVSTATDASGIATMEILIDGVSKQVCQNTTSCSYSIPSLTAGSHTILVRATDKSANANAGTATITVTKR